jgi:hypothetical protein
MASVPYSCIALKRRIFCRAACCSVVVIYRYQKSSSVERHFYARGLWRTKRQSEAAPVEFYFSLEEECSEERFFFSGVLISSER